MSIIHLFVPRIAVDAENENYFIRKILLYV